MFSLSDQTPVDWQTALASELKAPYLSALSTYLNARSADQATIYPPRELVFNALDRVPPTDVRVVILGQDPYHGAGQAHGLSFSVPYGQAVPASLRNIFKELQSDTGFVPTQHGNLEKWADQGVLLLNTVLTVEAGAAGSHRKRGWEQFTDAVIKTVNKQEGPVIFMLWGSDALSKAALINRSKHYVLSAPHPSPLSAYRGFFGCRHFSMCNALLAYAGRAPIDWQLV